MLPNNKVQWLDLASHLWLALVKLPLVRIVGIHYEIIVKYSKCCLTFFSSNYFLFMQYEDNDNGIS